MASKKYTLVLALLGLMQSASFAQTQNDASDSYVFDSSKVSVKNLPQYNEFSKNQYPYPARPKDQIELGGSVGLGLIVGDRGLFGKSTTGKGGYYGGPTGSITLRKSLGHVFSLRGGYAGSLISMPSTFSGDGSHLRWSYNETHMLGVDLIASLNTISHYRGNPKTNIYVMFGYQLAATRVKINNGTGLHTRYYGQEANLITTFGGEEKTNVDGAKRKAWALMHALDAGAGIAFKLSPKFNLAMEERIIAPMFGNDFLDGYKLGQSGDKWSYSSLRLNMNIGNSATHTEPLWWINPNNYVYNEVNKPRHMLIPPPVLPDADGDGVTDQFDLEPNTPAGAPVDSHGRAKDTDGDGVPDYKDKEILTQQSCFPVNADGVGTCPDPQCCKDIADKLSHMPPPPPACALTSLPSVTFKAGSAKLSKDAMNVLMGAASQLQANPACNVKVVGYVADASSKKAQQLSWDRVNAVIKYLVEKQSISEGRIIFSYQNQGDANTVDLQPTTETGPNTVPAPHPNLRSTK